VTDESGVELSKAGSSTALSSPRSEIVARGRKDALALLELVCNKCGERRALVFEGCVCAGCSDALDRQWGQSPATDWVLLSRPPTDKVNWTYPASAVACLSLFHWWRTRERREGAGPVAWPWPPLRLLLDVSPEAELFRPEDDGGSTKFIFRETEFIRVKVAWARADPSGAIEIGGPEASEVLTVRKDRDNRVARHLLSKGLTPEEIEHLSQETLERYIDAAPSWIEPTLIRPASAREIDLGEALLRESKRRAEVERILGRWGFEEKSLPLFGVTNASKGRREGAWEETRERFRNLGLLEGSVFDLEAELKALLDA
jgi:hypothetical protein